MGVTGLWPILAPTARPTPLPTLNRKRLAVDASIWIYQFLKAVRDKEGNALRNSHVVGFFRRICKLLFFGIKPVFVFDGGAPVLKRQTVLGRKQRREGRRDDAVRTAGRLLAVQMKRRGEEEEEKRKRDQQRQKTGLPTIADEEEPLPAPEDMVYVGEMGMSATERATKRKFYKKDAYHLPDVPDMTEMGQPNDPRIMSAEQLEEYARQFHNGEDVNLYDFSKIDFGGDFFMSLPAVDRYNILNAARLRSRLRMGLSSEQLEQMFPDRMAFSRFQIERVRERNELTQRLMHLNGMTGDDLIGVGSGRIAGEQNREYVLVKNEGVEGGYALGVVSKDKGVGERNKPIDVEDYHQKMIERTQPVTVDDESEEEFEDIPVEGLNRLPKLKNSSGQNMTYEAYREQEMADQKKKSKATRYGDSYRASETFAEEPAGLFVDDDPNNSTNALFSDHGQDEDEDLNLAIALSLQQDHEPDTDLAAEEHVKQAIALSLKAPGPQENDSDDDDFEDVPMPTYEQRAVEAPKPVVKASGRMLAHMLNNRANAAVPKPRSPSMVSDSDSDVDMQAALRKAKKKKEVGKSRMPPVVQNVKNPFDGPLPFEKLNFGGSLFGKTSQSSVQEPIVDKDEVDLAGGFELNETEAPKPLPPWLTEQTDIRSELKTQQDRDLELDAEDRERAREERHIFRQEHGPITIDSDEEGNSDVEILEGPPVKKSKMQNDNLEESNKNAMTETNIGELNGLSKQNIYNAVTLSPTRSSPPTANVLTDAETAEPIISQPTNHEATDEEQVDWSESDHGETAPKNTMATFMDSPKSRSSSVAFEDIIATDTPTSNQDMPVSEADALLQRLPPRSPPTLESSQPVPTLKLTETEEAELDAEFDDFSDPEDQELLAQLAAEAEEHARFASTLNNKSERENQESYEKELKALRSQQQKDRRDADEVSHIMITECQALLRLFGIPYITAPMEAEAQCAELVRLGLVDGIVTDDSDIFLFGGTRVYKNMFNSNKYVECYLASDLEKELSLSRDQLISIAHLLGSDYTEGLAGVGPVTAVEILSEFPSEKGLQEFKEWWLSVQLSSAPLNTEISTFRKKFRRSQATKLFLPPGFPSPAVTEAYLKPDVDSTPEPFQWGVPDLDRLRDFLMATIGWTQERTDEVLVPVIRDMSRREAEGTQANITRYFDGSVGAGVNLGKDGKAAGGSKRMKDAVSKLRAKKKGALEGTWAETAKAWAERETAAEEKQKRKEKEGEKAKAGRKKADPGTKRGGAAVVEDDDDGDGEAEVDGEADEGDDESDEVAATSGRKKGKAKATGKRKRT